ncbi:MAG: gamma-glutamyltransferase, partial [Gemmatimonadota bacterium]
MTRHRMWLRRTWWALALGPAVSPISGCAGAPEPAPTPVVGLPSPFVPADWPLFDQAVSVPAAHAAVSSVHAVASEVGAIIMHKGGNAVDAAVAVGFALAVVHPSAGNIGGGGFMVIRLASGEAYALDYRETAPAGASRDMYLDSLGALTEASVVGHLAAGVPGTVAGLAEAQARFGTLSMAEVMEPAIRLARDGFALDERRVEAIESAADRLRLFQASREQFLLPDGSVPAPGHLLVQPDLARTLQAIADSGARAFYEGGIADLIVAEMERGGGLISREDLA